MVLEVTRGQAEDVAQELDGHRDVDPADGVNQQILAQDSGEHLEQYHHHHAGQHEVEQRHVAVDHHPVDDCLSEQGRRQTQHLQNQGASQYFQQQRPVGLDQRQEAAQEPG